MKSTEVKAFAKINLSLDVLGKRADGYHEMLMVMQAVDLYDDISITLLDGANDITAETDCAFIPRNMDNLACRAAKAFFSAAGIKDMGAEISIKKRIPVCAGLAGGSSDAAAVIRGLNGLLNTGYDCAALEDISRSVGSDVAFCVSGGTMLAYERGDRLKRLPDTPDCCILVCKPSFSVSTPVLFSKIDSKLLKYHPDTDGLITAIEKQNVTEAARRCYNVFEEVLPERERRTVESIKDTMLTHGALGACMTGTGSAVYGIFAENEPALSAKAELCAGKLKCFITKPIKKVL